MVGCVGGERCAGHGALITTTSLGEWWHLVLPPEIAPDLEHSGNQIKQQREGEAFSELPAGRSCRYGAPYQDILNAVSSDFKDVTASPPPPTHHYQIHSNSLRKDRTQAT